MALKQEHSQTLEVVNPICCGLDVHKETISACLLSTADNGREEIQLREFGAFTDDLMSLRDWLLEHGCPVVAMESTGIYWRPVHNVLENALRIVLVNARHYRQVPGRKTDIKDSQWLAGLLRHGLLRGSFIPSREVRDWRDLTRLRKKYVDKIGDAKRRIQKVFESANIKIDSAMSDIFGTSGRNLIGLLIESESLPTREEVRTCLRGTLCRKEDEVYRAMQGFFRDHHRFQLRFLWMDLSHLETMVAQLEEHITAQMSSHQAVLDRLDEIPGVNMVAAQAILSHVGPTLNEFVSSDQLCPWAGLSPGNHESGGKRKSGKNYVAGHFLKTLMVETAWAAVKTKGSYYKDKYYRLKARRGAKRAIVAIAHRMMKAIFHIIKHNQRYKELGEDYLAKLNERATLARISRQARTLGYELVPLAG
jgi:transposase